jgi:hypothetical protein
LGDQDGGALERSFQRLAAFERDELRLVRHVLKVMFVFSLLDRQHLPLRRIPDYLATLPLYADFNACYFQLSDVGLAEMIVGELERLKVVAKENGFLVSRLSGQTLLVYLAACNGME